MSELDIVKGDLVWFIASDLFVRGATIARGVMRKDDDVCRSPSVLFVGSSDEPKHAGPITIIGRFVPWKARCLNKCLGPLIKDLFGKKGEKSCLIIDMS